MFDLVRQVSRKLATSKAAKAALVNLATKEFSDAMDKTFAPLGERLAKIAAIENPTHQRNVLLVLNAQLGEIGAAIVSDHSAATVLEQGMASSLAIGLAGGNP